MIRFGEFLMVQIIRAIRLLFTAFQPYFVTKALSLLLVFGDVNKRFYDG